MSKTLWIMACLTEMERRCDRALFSPILYAAVSNPLVRWVGRLDDARLRPGHAIDPAVEGTRRIIVRDTTVP